MAVMIKNGTDVVTFLKSQHEDIKAMLDGVQNSLGAQRKEAFLGLRRTLAVHETAARHAIPGGEAIVEARLREETAAKKELTELEKLDVDSAEFISRFADLKQAIIAHAEAEEREEFSRLAASIDPDRLARMQKAAIFAEQIAPTRPHPGVQSAAANLLVGPFLSMMDRVRDSLSTRSKS
jgi:hypothetical protein